VVERHEYTLNIYGLVFRSPYIVALLLWDGFI